MTRKKPRKFLKKDQRFREKLKTGKKKKRNWRRFLFSVIL